MPQLTSGPVVGVFASRKAAETAIHKLWHAGFAKEQIGFILPGGQQIEADTPMGKLEEQGANGAAVGSVAGGVVGALIGAAIGIAVPGLGVAIAGGILAEIGLGTAAGAALGAYTGPFLAMGFSDKDVHRFEHDVSADHGVLLVKAGTRQQEAVFILRDHGSLSVETPAVQPAPTDTKP
jgi:hypothetical protein